LLAKKSGVRAGDLALMMRQETAVFKINVQQLKNLGLTESLRTGYRLSPRGRVVLASLKEFPL
jgi:ribosomal protein S19E (S16A)